jgi:hypothetical protein
LICEEIQNNKREINKTEETQTKSHKTFQENCSSNKMKINFKINSTSWLFLHAGKTEMLVEHAAQPFYIFEIYTW